MEEELKNQETLENQETAESTEPEEKQEETQEVPAEEAPVRDSAADREPETVDKPTAEPENIAEPENTAESESTAESEAAEETKAEEAPAEAEEEKKEEEAATEAEEAKEEAEEEKPDPLADMGPEPEPYMEPDIRDLYIDYTDKLSGIEDNRYYRYLYEMVRAGENSFEQTNQILHKVVDETWIRTIEESLDALNRIIANPRKFIKTEEEVVPVGLAKKITSDSVKHLSRNTQLIESEPDEPVQPSKILNSTMQETYDLYENRFVYHLIQRLVRFIDKRTDVIFWATGDETQNHLRFESKVDDAYEQISYKVEMTIKNLTSFAENDQQHMETFARIDRLRRLTLSLRASSFCQIMSGCAMVRSPIQRTNLMIKDPDYRTCYRLWHFLEDYDDVGYRIEVLEDAMAFDQEYVSQMYTNMVGNYTIFKSLKEEEDRVLSDELREKLRLASESKDVTPKFIKEIHEEFVEDRNLPDVEIRRVFVEEVTQAQLDAEKKAEEAVEAMKAAQKETAAAQRQVKEARQMQEEAETRAATAVKRQEQAEAKIAEAVSDAQQAEKERRIAVRQAREEVNQIRADADLQIVAAQEKAQEEADYRISHYRVEAEEKTKKLEAELGGRAKAAEERAEEAEKARLAAEDKAVRSKKAREDAETALRTKEHERLQVAAERNEAQKNVKKLEDKLEVSERLRGSAERRAQQKVYNLQSDLKHVQTDLEDEKQAVRAAELKIEDLKRQLEEANKLNEQISAGYEQKIEELKEANKGILRKWFGK